MNEWNFAWQTQYLVMLERRLVAPRNVNEVSFQMMLKHVSLFAWQAQYVVGVTFPGSSSV